MRIALIGDIHGDAREVLDCAHFAKEAGAERIIYLGDFGWNFDEDMLDMAEAAFMDTGLITEFLDGNHENFEKLYRYPMDMDGYRYLSPYLRHIPRGTMLELDGKHALVMGGAVSIDRIYRRRNVTWWAEEEITHDDIVKGVNEFVKIGKVDAILSHEGPIIPEDNSKYDLWQSPPLWEDLHRSDVNRARLATLMEVVQPKFWYHGHHHTFKVTELPTSYGSCAVTCLAHSERRWYRMIVDTEDWISMEEAHVG